MVFDGFRFEVSCADADAPTGVISCEVLAVAESSTAALSEVKKVVGRVGEAKLVAGGSTVLAEARRRGVGDGRACIVQHGAAPHSIVLAEFKAEQSG